MICDACKSKVQLLVPSFPANSIYNFKKMSKQVFGCCVIESSKYETEDLKQSYDFIIIIMYISPQESVKITKLSIKFKNMNKFRYRIKHKTDGMQECRRCNHRIWTHFVQSSLWYLRKCILLDAIWRTQP